MGLLLIVIKQGVFGVQLKYSSLLILKQLSIHEKSFSKYFVQI